MTSVSFSVGILLSGANLLAVKTTTEVCLMFKYKTRASKQDAHTQKKLTHILQEVGHLEFFIQILCSFGHSKGLYLQSFYRFQKIGGGDISDKKDISGLSGQVLPSLVKQPLMTTNFPEF